MKKEIEKLYNSISNIDSQYIEDVRTKKAKKTPVWRKWGAIAACLCAIMVLGLFAQFSAPDEITAPGFLVITAYAASSDEGVTLQEGIDLPLDWNWSLAINSRPGIPLKLSAEEHPDATFEVSTEEGSLLLWENNRITTMNSPSEVGNGTTIYWNNIYQTNENDVEKYMGATAYINIVIREKGNIVGYAVVEIHTDDLENAPAQTYDAKLLKSVSFPKVDEKYQKITNEYVQSQMEQVRNETATTK